MTETPAFYEEEPEEFREVATAFLARHKERS